MKLKGISFLLPPGFEGLQDFIGFLTRTIDDQAQQRENERLYLSGGW